MTVKIAYLRKIMEKAPRGPYGFYFPEEGHRNDNFFACPNYPDTKSRVYVNHDSDALQFASAACSALPELLDEIERLRAGYREIMKHDYLSGIPVATLICRRALGESS